MAESRLSQAGALGPRSASTPQAAGVALRPLQRGQAPAAGGKKKKCYKCGGVGHLQHQCPSRAGTAASRGSQAARCHNDFCQPPAPRRQPAAGGGSRKLPPPRKHHKAGPSERSGQRGSQAASASGAPNTGRKRARDPTTTSRLTPPNKQVIGTTRFSYAMAVEGGKRVVLGSLDGTALTKDDPKLLGDAVNKWTLGALAKMEYHNVPEVFDARPTKLGLEVKTSDYSTSLHTLPSCARPRST